MQMVLQIYLINFYKDTFDFGLVYRDPKDQGC